MSFLYPAFLFGLFAVAIPIIIHLFNFHRPKKILFTNVRFLKVVKENTSSKLKIKHYLILLSRILFIIFLVLTFAQPFLESKNSDSMKGTPYVSVYLDNSFSMQNEIDKEKALDLAIKSVTKLTETYPSGTKYYFLTNDFEGKDQFLRNKEKVNERITEVKFSNLFRDASSVYKRQAQTLEKADKGNNHIFWFSDFQKSTLGDFQKLTFDTSSKVYLVPIQNTQTSNVYIDSVWLSSPMVKANENNTLEVVLRNDGDRKVKDLVMKLYINDVQVSTSSVSIEPNGNVKSQFVFNIAGEGQKKCRISFEDFPIAFDNDYYFVLNVSPKIKILHLYEKETQYIPKVYSNENVFALQSNPIGDFDNSLIGVSDLIVIDAVREIPSSLTEPLKDFVKKGGSLFIYPAGDLSIDSYNYLFASLFIPKVSKASLSAGFSSAADSNYLKANNTLLAPDFENPFFKGLFEKTDKKMNMPYAFPSLTWGTRGETLLKLKNDDPFLTLFSVEKGNVYLAATPLEDKYTNFPNHSIYVLVMYKAGFNSVTEGERLAYSFQDPVITLDIENKSSQEIYTLTSGNLNVIPGQRLSGRKLMLEVPKDEMKPGFYILKSGEKEEKLLAFNYGKEESQQKFYTPEEIKKLVGQNNNVQIYQTESADDFISKFKNENIGVPLWKYSLILCLLFLAIEILLIRFL